MRSTASASVWPRVNGSRSWGSPDPESPSPPKSLLGLLPTATVTGRIEFDGRDVLTMPAADLRALRGAEMSYVFQDPLSSLDPVRSIGDQVCQPLRIRGVSRKDAKARALDMLAAVGIPEPARRYGEYPHQFSGGMRQRVMIAMALIGEPRLVVADEPTTALDVRVQAKIVDLLYALTEERGVAVVFITHDLGIVAGLRRPGDRDVCGPGHGELHHR